MNLGILRDWDHAQSTFHERARETLGRKRVCPLDRLGQAWRRLPCCAQRRAFAATSEPSRRALRGSSSMSASLLARRLRGWASLREAAASWLPASTAFAPASCRAATAAQARHLHASQLAWAPKSKQKAASAAAPAAASAASDDASSDAADAADLKASMSRYVDALRRELAKLRGATASPSQ